MRISRRAQTEHGSASVAVAVSEAVAEAVSESVSESDAESVAVAALPNRQSNRKRRLTLRD